jgi:hypothetical protein
MPTLSRGQTVGIVAILLITVSFIGAAVYGVMFGDTAAAKHYSAVSPGLRSPNKAPAPSGRTRNPGASG